MRILVVGGGGREHALCWTIAGSPLCDALFCAPGNAGIAEDATLVDIKAEDIDGIVAFARKETLDLVVVGPEAPLVAGLVDRLQEAGIRAFGPTAAAARLEGSKGFMKDLCAKHGIPTAAYGRFDDVEAARAHIRKHGAPVVVKADGLAAGKGVTVAQTVEEAIAAVDAAMVDGAFGAAGREVVVEEFMEGEELSFFALCDGATALPLASAQDHKAAFDGDRGPNTGGMGAYSPAPVCTPELEARIVREILDPTVAAMKAEGAPYSGVLFIGLMITAEGPKVMEYNVRFGDPECQVLMMRLKSDLVPALKACADGALADLPALDWDARPAVCLVMAAPGYPEKAEKGSIIRGVDSADDIEGVEIFHAGTAENERGELMAAGGRVLNVTASGDTLRHAVERAYAAANRIDWPEAYYRKDIAWRALRPSN